MIVTDVENRDEFIYVVNPHDLSGYNPEDVAEQHEFIRWVQETPIEFIPSGRYWSMAEAAAKGENYGIYSGYLYQFWAKSWEDARAMYEKWPWRIWCEKRHPEVREITLRAKVFDSVGTVDQVPCWSARIENVEIGTSIGKDHLNNKYGGDMRKWLGDFAVRSVVYHSFQDGMNKKGIDALPAHDAENFVTLDFPEGFGTTREFTVTVRYTAPYDAEPVTEAANEA